MELKVTEPGLPVFISIGSNLGEKYDNCIKGIDYLNTLDTTRVIQISPFYRTQPVDYTDQDWFVNAVVKIDTILEPVDLMRSLKKIEEKIGQFKKQVRFGPRLIDLDIILFKNRTVDSGYLTIPHPRMHKRCFVLKPLCDISPDVIHPVLKQSAAELLKKIENIPDQEVFFFSEQ